MSAEDYARNAERVEQARRLIDLLELAYRAQALDLQREVERQLTLLLGLEMRR
jgi:transcription elongation GreA/GreB family factor